MSDLLSSEPRPAQLNDALGEGLNLKGLQPLLGFAGGAANSLIQLFLMVLLAILLALIQAPPAHGGGHDARPARERWSTCSTSAGKRWGLAEWHDPLRHHRFSAHLGRLVAAEVPLALLSALVCGLLTFVPTIGPTAATLLPTGLALLQSPQLMLSVLVFRLVLQNLEAFLLTPLLLRKTVNLLPTVALTAQLSLGALGFRACCWPFLWWWCFRC